MSNRKYLYAIRKFKIKPWLKYWLMNKIIPSGGVLSEILTGTSFTLENSLDRLFNKFDLKGNTVQDGTPTPDSPISIQNVSGSNNIKVQNKNLFDETQLLQATGWTKNSDGYYNGTFSAFNSKWEINGFNIDIDGTKQHTISFDYYVTGGSAIIRFIYDDNTYTGIGLTATTNTHIIQPSTPGKTITKIMGTYGTGGSQTLYIKNIQLEEGSTATDYVSHEEQNLPVNLKSKNLYNPANIVNYAYGSSGGDIVILSASNYKGYYIECKGGDIFSISRDSLSNNRFRYCFTKELPAPGVICYNGIFTSIYDNELKIENIIVPNEMNYIFFYFTNQNEPLPNIQLELRKYSNSLRTIL